MIIPTAIRNGAHPAIIKGLKPADLKRFYETHMRPEQAAVIAVGDIALDELKQQLEGSLGTLEVGLARAGRVRISRCPQPKPTSLVLIDKPHAAQSVIHLALVGSRRNTADFFAQNVMNMVFGGQFSSRLNLNLREQKGYTYGARSAWDWRVNERGPFVATSSVQTAVTAPALSEFLKELEGMVGARPVEEKELDFCKKYVTRGYTAGFETPSQVATQLETLFAYKLPDDYFNTRRARGSRRDGGRHHARGEEVSGLGPPGDHCRRRPGEDRAGAAQAADRQGTGGLSVRR